MPRSIFSSFYVELHFPLTLLISNRNLVQLLEQVGWVNGVIIEENVHPNLAKIFYYNTDTSEEKRNHVITHIGGVAIEFGVSVLNKILRT